MTTTWINGDVKTHLTGSSRDCLESIAESQKAIAMALKRIADVMDGTKEVEEFTEEVKERIIKENKELLEVKCPSCGSRDLESVRFRDLMTYEPYILVQCNSCGKSRRYRDSPEIWEPDGNDLTTKESD